MPCRYEDYDAIVNIPKEKKDDLDTITRLACDYCKLLDETSDVPSWAKSWWKKHKKIDQERLRREGEEALRESHKAKGLAKLSPAERKALGV